MRQRRVMAAASALVLALGLAACGGSDDDSADTSAGKLEGTGPFTIVTGKDTSGNLQNQVNAWNKDHANEKVTVVELPESADAQRERMVTNAQTKSDEFGVLNLDVIWTAEFAANGWIEQLPEDEFPLDKLLPTTIETGKYFKKLYAVPVTSDGGLLYYRKDLLDAAGVSKPPTTWAEMKTACDAVLKLPAAKGTSCYAGQFDKYEGLTVNFSEAVNSAGGEVVNDEGKANVNTEEAKKGLNFLVDGFKNGVIPKKALTFKEEEGRRAFEAGELIFHRQWPYQWTLANTPGTSKVAGKFNVAPLPGLDGPGVSTLGGHNLAISSFTKNKKTALDFIKFMTSSERQLANLQASSQAPTIAALYDDQSLVAKFPYLPTLKASIENAQKRPEAVKYQELSSAISGEAYDALNGTKSTDDALKDLQSELEKLTQK